MIVKVSYENVEANLHWKFSSLLMPYFLQTIYRLWFWVQFVIIWLICGCRMVKGGTTAAFSFFCCCTCCTLLLLQYYLLGLHPKLHIMWNYTCYFNAHKSMGRFCTNFGNYSIQWRLFRSQALYCMHIKVIIVIINFFFWKNISRVFQTKTTKNISIQLLMDVWIDNRIDQLLTVCFFNNNSDADEKEENFKVFNKLLVINYFYEVNSRLLISYFSVFIESARFDRVSG